MSSECAILLIILSHQVQQRTYASSLDVLIELEKTFCPYRRYCNANVSSDGPRLFTSQRPCCLSCSCADDCYQYDNCCPDKAAQETSLTTFDRDGESPLEATSAKPRFVCQTPQLISTSQVDLEAKSYYMIDRCHERYLGLRGVIKCEADRNAGSYLEQIPVYVPEKNILYKNVHCALCNFERMKKTRLAEAILRCNRDVFGEFIGLGEPADIFAYITESRAPACNIFYEVPNDLQDPISGVTECSPIDVSTCNTTGIWELYDAELEEGCRNYYAPWTAAQKRSRRVYKNLACLKCNHNYVEHLAACQIREHIRLPPDVNVKLYVNPSLIQDSEKQADRVSEMNDVKSQSGGRCKMDQFLDVHTSSCRYAECPLDQYKVDGICSPVFIMSSRLSFETAAKVYIQPKDLQALDNDSALIHELLALITDHLSKTFKICNLSVWIKTPNETAQPVATVTKTDKARNENSFLVFHMVMYAKNSSLPYHKALTYFEFLQTNMINDGTLLSKWKFYFADHIFFDKGANKVIDLVDDVELVHVQREKLSLQFLNRMRCKVFMRMTEMRLCKRVKIDSEEYDTFEKKLYLKNAGVFMYGNEYFVNRNNDTFVCIDRYNDVMNKTENGKQVNDKAGEFQQEKREPSLITKDFAFFIGCLALVALFVTVALAKKKYLLSKATNTVIVG